MFGMSRVISSAPSWLSVGTESGVLPPGECVDIDVVMDASALEAGDYYGTLNLTSNDPADPTKTMDVVFHVGSVDAAYSELEPVNDTITATTRSFAFTGGAETITQTPLTLADREPGGGDAGGVRADLLDPRRGRPRREPPARLPPAGGAQIAARQGTQLGAGTWQLLKTTPRSASRSRLGVSM